MKVLLIEDNPGDARLIREMLVEDGGDFELFVAGTLSEGLASIESGGIDILLTDLGLPDSQGLETFTSEHSRAPDVPIIVLTGNDNEEMGSVAVREGAQDYLVKGRVDADTLGRCIRYAIERKRADEALREQERHFRSLIENASDIIVIIDEEANFHYASPSIERILGYRPEELEGGNAFDYIHPDDVPAVAGAVALGVKRNSAETAEFRFKLKAGGWRFFEGIGAVLPEEQAGVRIVVNCRDITERKQAEVELRRINAELDGYAHTVSHDLRGPLSAIKMANDMLQEILKTVPVDDIPPETMEVADIIDSSVDKSLALVQDLLYLAEAGQVPKTIAEVDISSTVARVLKEFAGRIQEKDVGVNVSGDMGTVLANPTHIYQVFLNLISNAIAHNNSAEPVIEISHPGDDGEGGHRYLVKDNGPGIPTDELENIFIPFFKGKTGGTGIGLATVNKIIGVYGGNIRAFNDNGACFEFVIRDLEQG